MSSCGFGEAEGSLLGAFDARGGAEEERSGRSGTERLALLFFDARGVEDVVPFPTSGGGVPDLGISVCSRTILRSVSAATIPPIE